jgi:hypothetical protein
VKPGIDQILMSFATTLATRIAPELAPDSYATGDARIVAMLSVLVAQETDRAADTLARENREMRMLFLGASLMDVLPALRVRLGSDAAMEEPDFRLSTLSGAHDRYTETLMALQASIEGINDEWARALNREIWQFLLRSAEARLLVLPMA